MQKIANLMSYKPSFDFTSHSNGKFLNLQHHFIEMEDFLLEVALLYKNLY